MYLKFILGLLIISVGTIPLSSYLSARLFFLTFILSLPFLNRINSGRLLHYTADGGIYLLVMVIGLYYSDDINTGLKVLETSFTLLAIPIIFSLVDRQISLHRSLIFYSFMAGLSLACLLSLSAGLVNYIATNDMQSFFYYNLTAIIHSHPTYFAYYLIASITYCLYLLFNEVRKKYQVILVVGIIFFFGTLMLTGGRTAYVSVLLIFSFFILKYILEKRSESKTISFVLVTLLIIGLFWLNNVDYFRGELVQNNDYWERSALWKAAIKANPSPFLGVGTGDYKSVLNEYYEVHGMNEFVSDSYNSHNQFIQLYFSNGILGLLSLIILIGRPLYLSTIDNNVLGVLLIFPFIIYGVTEVFLGRYQGVVFFALLHQIVIYQHYSNRQYSPLKQA